MIALIAAVGENGVIGKDGTMPWHLPADLKYFRRLTKGHIVVMGRKTYDSIGQPLRGRVNIILTRDRDLTIPGCEVIHDLSAVLAEQRPVFVIGGAEVYRQALPLADLLYLTRVHEAFDGDTFFPELNESEWELESVDHHSLDADHAYDYSFEVYRRRKT